VAVLNKLFGYAYEIRLIGKRLEQWRRPLLAPGRLALPSAAPLLISAFLIQRVLGIVTRLKNAWHRQALYSLSVCVYLRQS
jgi:hypothetical protein